MSQGASDCLVCMFKILHALPLNNALGSFAPHVLRPDALLSSTPDLCSCSSKMQQAIFVCGSRLGRQPSQTEAELTWVQVIIVLKTQHVRQAQKAQLGMHSSSELCPDWLRALDSFDVDVVCRWAILLWPRAVLRRCCWTSWCCCISRTWQTHLHRSVTLQKLSQIQIVMSAASGHEGPSYDA